MTETLYPGILPDNDPMLTDPSVDFASARLTDDNQHVVIANQKPHHIAAYPCKNVMSVGKGAYDTIVIMGDYIAKYIARIICASVAI